MKLSNKYVFLSLVVLFGFVQPAYAYLDPGAASMVLQALVGGVAATVGVASLYYGKIKQFFSKALAKKSK